MTNIDNARTVREAAISLYRAMRRANPDAWAEIDEVEDWAYWDDIVRTAQVTLAAGRAETTTVTVEDARAEAWRRFPDGIDVETGEPVDDYGYPATAREAFIGGAEWAAARTETTTGAIARGEALAAGDPDWMNVTRWPRTEAEATTVILRLIEENRNLRTTVDADLEYQRRLEARLAAVEALLTESEAQDWTFISEVPLVEGDRLRAALSAAPTDTTKETDR